MHGLKCPEPKVHTKIHFSDQAFDKLELCVKQKPEKVTETFMKRY